MMKDGITYQHHQVVEYTRKWRFGSKKVENLKTNFQIFEKNCRILQKC